MAEEIELPESGGGGDPVAIGIAMSRSSPGVDAELIGYLHDQRRHLHAQLRPAIWAQWLGVFLRAATAVMGVATAAALAVMVWQAWHSDGVVVESFAVPPDLAEKGLSGQVVATQLEDGLRAAVAPSAVSVTKATSVLSDRSDDIRVEIPDTGVSVSEVYRFLRHWLGHETAISGEIFHGDNGLAVSVQIDGRDGATYEGPQLADLLRKAAAHVAEIVDPVQYASRLINTLASFDEAKAMLQRVSYDPNQPVYDRVRCLNQLAALEPDIARRLAIRRQLQALMPDYPVGRNNLMTEEIIQGHAEAALATVPATLHAYEHAPPDYSAVAVTEGQLRSRAVQALLLGDMGEAARLAQHRTEVSRSGTRYVALVVLAQALAAQHDSAARNWLNQASQPANIQEAANPGVARLQVEASLKNWPGVIKFAPAAIKAARGNNRPSANPELVEAVFIRPALALAQAMTGDFATAEHSIAATPGDCYDCVRTRGLVAAAAKQWGRADFWFARAVAQGPSLPMAHEDWGRALLDRGDAGGAIAQFTVSNSKGSHFADALEGWGEALMAQNQSHLALAKFAEAERYAPNWGRLHLKWGEALTYAGKRDDARAQFARAAALDLTAAEKTELARSHAVAPNP